MKGLGTEVNNSKVEARRDKPLTPKVMYERREVCVDGRYVFGWKPRVHVLPVPVWAP